MYIYDTYIYHMYVYIISYIYIYKYIYLYITYIIYMIYIRRSYKVYGKLPQLSPDYLPFFLLPKKESDIFSSSYFCLPKSHVSSSQSSLG